MSISDDQINLGRSSCSQVLQEASPSIFALLSTGPQRQHFLVSCQVYSQGDEDHGRISLFSMTHTEMDAIQIENTPMLEASGARARR